MSDTEDKKQTTNNRNPFPTDDFHQMALFKCFGKFDDPQIILNEVRPGKYRATAIYNYEEHNDLPLLSQIKLVWNDKEIPFQYFKDAYIQAKIGNFDKIDLFIEQKQKKEKSTDVTKTEN